MADALDLIQKHRIAGNMKFFIAELKKELGIEKLALQNPKPMTPDGLPYDAYDTEKTVDQLRKSAENEADPEKKAKIEAQADGLAANIQELVIKMRDGLLMVPGFNGVPFDAEISDRGFAGSDLCGWFPSPFTVRELEMLRLINSLTDRPGWEELVFDASTMQTWRSEAMAQFPLISPKTWDWCEAELRDKAQRWQETGLIMVLNAASGVCKSDTIIPPSVAMEIQGFVNSALKESDGQMDWAPASNQQVWNLIDPSLYPLVRERTRVLVSSGSVPLEKTLDAYGQGEAPPPLHEDRHDWEVEKYIYSLRYQWLPCEVEFCGPAGSTDVRITSYVNNLHPREQRPFYRVLESVISKTIEPWNQALIRLAFAGPLWAGREPMRIRTFGVEWDNRYPQWAEDLPTTLDVDKSTEDYPRALARLKEYLSLPEYGLKVQWSYNSTREIPADWEATLSLREVVNIKYSRMFRFQHSEPGTTYSYEDWKAGRTAHAIKSHEIKDPMVHNEILRAKDEVDHQFQTVKLQDEFREKGLQIIVKLGGIELAPDNPSFLGEDWHVDGLANEHIAGVALYCFDLGNVANPRISFAHEISMDADDFSFSYFNWDIPYLERLFGVQNEKPSFQELGSVSIRQGGLIAFPNCIYHRLESFELVDKARPGRCRFLTLWLVDPYYRIRSTRNVPPQRLDWWEQEARSHLSSAHPLPQELADQIITEAGLWLMNLPEAQHHRRERAKEEALAYEKIRSQIERNTICLLKQ
ncbi:hypothetical protein KXW65_009012 [Aspergillus fumigatus]|nr:hypothetical protein KXX30_009221 [Aspergillus fumigatus]KAH1310095.1 hypothetical protein KXX66_009296 [Aspergillus fumigatus]KAH1320303.1 hypothetical protein KXX38_009501 [Aspergillus fumigatus]KAH1413536.1 hypothetical protein KXX22_008256 [Aspergillus fumigatus]KAH1443504.1 hypothetical protein KXX68_009401 [Aspergillus fumigatus]